MDARPMPYGSMGAGLGEACLEALRAPPPRSRPAGVCYQYVLRRLPPPEISMLHRARTVTECQEALGAFPGPLERYGEQIACANWLGKAGGKAGDGF